MTHSLHTRAVLLALALSLAPRPAAAIHAYEVMAFSPEARAAYFRAAGEMAMERERNNPPRAACIRKLFFDNDGRALDELNPIYTAKPKDPSGYLMVDWINSKCGKG